MTEIQDKNTRNGKLSAEERRKLRQNIAELRDNGLSVAQIGARLQISARSVQHHAAQMGLTIGRQSGKTRRIGGHGSVRLAELISEVAAEAGVGQSVMVIRALQAVFVDKASAVRFLGKAAKAKRLYDKK